MKGLLIRFTVTGIAVLLASKIVPGIEVTSLGAGLAAVIVLALLNAVIRPILYLFSLPFIILTLGVFMVIINALLLQLVAFLVKGFVVEGFWPSVGGALLISLVSSILNLWVSDHGRMEIVVHRPKPPRVIN
ncbi:MAG: phage holin family protein [Nitrospiraceae bacterium]